MTARRGFSLVELVTALALASLLAVVAAPRLLAFLPRYRADGAARELLGDFRLARSLAAARGVDVLIRFDSPAANRYIVAYDTDPPPPNNDHRVTDKDEGIKVVEIGQTHEGIELTRYLKGAGSGPSGSALPVDGVSFQDGTALLSADGRARAGSVYLRPTRDAGITRLTERCLTVTGATGRARLYAWKGTAWE